MFKWKIYVYKNVNGKEQKIEKEFTDPREYEQFVTQNPEFAGLSNLENRLGFGEFADFNKYLDNFFNSKLEALWFVPEDEYYEEKPALVEDVNLSKYEEEARKIEEEKQQKEEEKSALKATLEKLKSYLEKFKNEDKKDLVKQVEEDIKKVEEKLKNLIGK